MPTGAGRVRHPYVVVKRGVGGSGGSTTTAAPGSGGGVVWKLLGWGLQLHSRSGDEAQRKIVPRCPGSKYGTYAAADAGPGPGPGPGVCSIFLSWGVRKVALDAAC
jgi:hypothetical protein